MITINEVLYNKMPDDIKHCFNKLFNQSSEEVVSGFPDSKSGDIGKCVRTKVGGFLEHGGLGKEGDIQVTYGDKGSASRFFYCAKASKSERNAGLEKFKKGEPPASARSKPAEGRNNSLGEPRANFHPTVKPVALMQYLCRLITPKGGKVLDPFCGSGSTGIGAVKEGFNFIGIEKDPEYVKIAEARIKNAIDSRETDLFSREV